MLQVGRIRLLKAEAGAGHNGKMTHLKDLVDLFPGGELEQTVGADDQMKVIPVPAAKSLDRIDRIGLALSIQFDR